MIDPGEKILVGKIIAPHGIGGLLSIEGLSDNPKRFAPGATLATAAGQRLTVERSQIHKGRLLVGFAGIADRDAADKLRGEELFIEQSEVAKLPKGVYYHYQIVGLTVKQQGQTIGVVSDILTYSANDIYLTKKEGGGEILIPALKSVVKSIDLEQGVMEVELPEGL